VTQKGAVTVEDYADWFEAVRGGYANMLREMADANPRIVNVTNYNGGTALHEAAVHGKPEIVALLLQLGAKPDANDEEGGTPLHTAAMQGEVQIMKMLIDKGAQLESRQGDNITTPLHCAACRGHLEAVQLLVEAGADINAKDGRGKTALDAAKTFKRAPVAQYLDRAMTRHAFAAEAETLTQGLQKPLTVGHHISLKSPQAKPPTP
jgi:ankyrin repeat protein